MGEEKVQISVRGRYDPQYAIVVNHEGYVPVTAAAVQIRNRFYLKDVRYTINKKVDRDAIDFAVRHLRQPFFVIPKDDDLVSNSGNHSVVFSDSFLSARGLYILEKELTFPRPRPKVDLMEKLKKRLLEGKIPDKVVIYARVSSRDISNSRFWDVGHVKVCQRCNGAG